jgi:chromosome segregation ATPase
MKVLPSDFCLNNELTFRQMKDKTSEVRDRETDERRNNDQRKYQLEDLINNLETENRQHCSKISGLESELEQVRSAAKQESSELKREIHRLESLLEESNAKETFSQSKNQSVAKLQDERDQAILQMKVAIREKEKAENELKLNAEAIKHRQMMKERIEKYPALVKENESLRKENKLLLETQENIELLKQENGDLKERLEQVDKQVEEGLHVKNELEFALSKIHEWESVCKKMLTLEERNEGMIVSPNTLLGKISHLQRRDIQSADEYHSALGK